MSLDSKKLILPNEGSNGKLQKQNNSREFTQSLHQTGFSVLKDHPIDFQLINSVYSEWEMFFNNQKKYDYISILLNKMGIFLWVQKMQKVPL